MLDEIIKSLSEGCKDFAKIKVMDERPKPSDYTRTLHISSITDRCDYIIIDIGELCNLETMIGNVLGIPHNDKFKLYPRLTDRNNRFVVMDEMDLYNFIKSKELHIINDMIHEGVRLHLNGLGTLSKKPQFMNILNYVVQSHGFLLNHVYVCIGIIIGMDRTIIPFITTGDSSKRKVRRRFYYETDRVFIEVEDDISRVICISDITYDWDDYKHSIEEIVDRTLSELCKSSYLYREIEVVERLNKKLPRNN